MITTEDIVKLAADIESAGDAIWEQTKTGEMDDRLALAGKSIGYQEAANMVLSFANSCIEHKGEE